MGGRKLHHALQPFLSKAGIGLGRDKLFDILRAADKLVKPKKSFHKTTYSRHSYAVAPNRVKGLAITAPGQVLVSDITYLRLERGEFAYLFLTTDAFSRKVLGYHVSRDLSHYSARLALAGALKELKSSFGVIHHSDRGCQYCCHEFLAHLQEAGVIPSMTDEMHCYQNAVAERLNGILKDEFDLDAVFQSFEEARRAVQQAVTVYNMKRSHFSLGLRTPQEVYAEAA
jgi:transposase InsO family protein